MAHKAEALGRDERLRDPRGFQAVFQQGKRIERRILVLLWRRVPGRGRVGFTVSRQVGGAVARTRVRRRIREAYRRLDRRAPAGVDLVIIGRPAAAAAVFTALKAELAEALGSIRSDDEARS